MKHIGVDFQRAATKFQKHHIWDDILCLGYSQVGGWNPQWEIQLQYGLEKTSLQALQALTLLPDQICQEPKHLKTSYLHTEKTSCQLPYQTIAGGICLQTNATLSGPKLTFLGLSLDGPYTKKLSLPALQHIQGDLRLESIEELNLPQLQSLSGNLYVPNATKIQLPNLKTLGGRVEAKKAKILEMPALQTLLGDLHCPEIKTLSLPNLIESGNLIGTQLTQLHAKNLQSLKTLKIPLLQSLELPNLKSIRQDLEAPSLKTAQLPKMQSVGGNWKTPLLESLEAPNLDTIIGSILIKKNILTAKTLSKLLKNSTFLNKETLQRKQCLNTLLQIQHLQNQTKTEIS